MLVKDKLFIGGQWVAPSTRETIEVHNAGTGAVMGTIPAAGEKEVDAAVRAARDAASGIVILSVPFEHTAPTLKSLQEVLQPGATLVSMGVPLASAIGDVAGRMLGVSQGSVAELCASLVPAGVEVVSAFQNVAAHRLADRVCWGLFRRWVQRHHRTQ